MVDILIVEDNKELADLLCDFLRAENYVVSVADSGEKALALYERYGAKLLVLDVMLPGIDGFGAVGRRCGALGLGLADGLVRYWYRIVPNAQ